MANVEPTQVEIIREALRSHGLDLHTGMPGRVVKYYASEQTADVLPVIRRPVPKADGTDLHEDLPVLPKVPLVWPRAGGYYIHFPLAAGDHVWLSFSETGTAFWRSSGDISPPGDLARHSLSYPVAFPGIGPADDTFGDAPAAEAVMVVPSGGRLRVSTEGGTADFVALAAKVDANFDAIIDLFSNWTPVANDGGAALKTLTGSLSFDPVGATKLKAE